MSLKPTMVPWAVRGAALLLAAAWLHSQIPPRPMATEKLKDDLYLVSAAAGNVLVYVTVDGLILVDDMYERQFDELLPRVRAISPLPIRYVLNTHHHDDHAGGNAKFEATGAQLIQHQGARAGTLKAKQTGPASVTYSDEMAIMLGGKEVRARHFGRGHTSGDAVIYFPAHRVIHTGDLFLTNNTLLPFMDFAYGGSAVEWPGTLDRMLATEFDIVVPGHGAVSDRAGVLRWRAGFQTMLDRVRTLVRTARPKEEVVRLLVDEYKWPPQGLAIAQVDAFIAEVRK